ncbi:DUF4468 domain-containing protein [Pedobacter chitinilyticus]|uniref:DUF4468 domain-containing protein n=1 Tax=Pedobacter chitinilyticus TaxID=2233776 RepID=UPI001F097673|nr:DUF4468 domain-containing protein [Pedobacter chitinilyticus]
MKTVSLLMLLLGLSTLLFAQEIAPLPKDETGKYTYYEVVSTAVSQDTLKARMQNFIQKQKKELKPAVASAKELVANGKLIIRKSMAMLSHPSGEIAYRLYFEANHGKYRFWLSDFEFFPYQKDRYGNFVPSTTVGIPLETEAKKWNADQWDEYRLQTSKYATEFATRLKDYLINKAVQTPKPPEKKVISKTWD